MKVASSNTTSSSPLPGIYIAVVNHAGVPGIGDDKTVHGGIVGVNPIPMRKCPLG